MGAGDREETRGQAVTHYLVQRPGCVSINTVSSFIFNLKSFIKGLGVSQVSIQFHILYNQPISNDPSIPGSNVLGAWIKKYPLVWSIRQLE